MYFWNIYTTKSPNSTKGTKPKQKSFLPCTNLLKEIIDNKSFDSLQNYVHIPAAWSSFQISLYWFYNQKIVACTHLKCGQFYRQPHWGAGWGHGLSWWTGQNKELRQHQCGFGKGGVFRGHWPEMEGCWWALKSTQFLASGFSVTLVTQILSTAHLTLGL